jgi:hypothetical protein
MPISSPFSTVRGMFRQQQSWGGGGGGHTGPYMVTGEEKKSAISNPNQHAMENRGYVID